MILQPSFGRMARKEYGAAVRWYDKHRRGLGAEFEAEIQRTLARACEGPRRFVKVVADVHRIRVHRFPFVIFFRVRQDRLIVLAVFHARRDPTIWHERT